MAMKADHIEQLITNALPGAKVTITDLAGDGDHYSALVIYEGFKGLPRVKQHKIVYDALQGRMGGDLHALQLKTAAE